MYLRMSGKGLQLKTTALLVFFLYFIKSYNNRIVDHLEKYGVFFLISSIYGFRSFRPTEEVAYFLQSYLLRLLTVLGLLELEHLIYPRLLDRV